MASVINVDLIEDDNEDATFLVTSNGTALNLSGVTVTAVIKASESVEDDDPGAYTLTVGSGLTIVDAAAGKVKLTFPTAVTASPSIWFYKIQVTASGSTKTAILGWANVQDA